MQKYKIILLTTISFLMIFGFGISSVLAAACGYANGQLYSGEPPAAGLCSSGYAMFLTRDTGGSKWTWTCVGTPTVSCSANNTDSCGSAAGGRFLSPPTSNLCTSGTIPEPIGVYSCDTSDPCSWNSNFGWKCGNYGCAAYYPALCGPASGGSYSSAPPSGDLCTYGHYLYCDQTSSLSVIGNQWFWVCNWGNDLVYCYADKPTSLVNGSCGTSNGTYTYTAPSTNLCSTGSASSVTTNATNFTWSCNGSGGGTNASCSAYRKVDAQCGSQSNPSGTGVDSGSLTTSSPNLCVAGAGPVSNFQIYNSGDGDAYWWKCDGLNGGNSSDWCLIHIKVNGVLGTANGRTYASTDTSWGSYTQCSAGNSSNTTFPSAGGSTSWVCNGIWGGTNSGTGIAYRAAAAVNGSCGTSNGQTFTSVPSTNLCSAGTASSVTSGTTTYTWTCNGSGGGTNASCSATRNYIVTYTSSTGGSCTPSSRTVAYNATSSAPSCTPSSGYTLSGFTRTSGSGGTLNTSTGEVTNVTGAQTIRADFVLVVVGVCGTSNGQTLTSAPSTNLCSAGTASSVISGTTTYTWSCAGSGGGSTASCSATRNYIVTYTSSTGGSCTPSSRTVAYNATSSAPSCTPSSGYTLSGFTRTSGSGGTLNTSTGEVTNVTGAQTIRADFVLVVVGVCGTADGRIYASTDSSWTPYTQCATGTPSSTTFPLAGSSTTWTCLGENGGADSPTCSASRTVGISCGTSHNTIRRDQPLSNLCVSSTNTSLSFNSNAWWWNCESSPEIPAACYTYKTTCGSSHGQTLLSTPSTNLCTYGTASSVTSGDTTYNWTCTGNDSLAVSCSAIKIIIGSGVCGSADGQTFGAVAPTTNLCNFGEPSLVSSGGTSHTWSCTGTLYWLTNYQKRKLLTITSDEDLTDYQVKVVVSYDSDMQADFDDIRFTSSDGLTELKYWLESKNDSSTATFWVKIPSLINGSNTIYMYYGNSGVSSASNGENTFDLFFDFTTSIPSGWTTPTTNSYVGYTFENGDLVLYGGTRGKSTFWSSGNETVYNTNIAVNNKIAETRYKAYTGGTLRGTYVYRHMLVGLNTVNTSYPWYAGRHKLYNYWLTFTDVASTTRWGITPWNGALTDYNILGFAYDGNYRRIYENYTLQGSYNAGYFQPDSKIALNASTGDASGNGAVEGYYDWVRIRKYSMSEPITSFDAEENNTAVAYCSAIQNIVATCGPAHGTVFSIAPANDLLCSGGSPSSLSGLNPWSWTCNGYTNDPWYSTSWTKRQSITINSVEALTDHQVKLTIPYDSDMQADFDDIRFTSSDGLTELKYWLESKTDSSTATFWVKIPSLINGSNTIYMYYGNSLVTTASNGNNVFVLFDDFSASSIDTNKWTTGYMCHEKNKMFATTASGWSTPSISSGRLSLGGTRTSSDTITEDGTTAGWLGRSVYSKNEISLTNFVMESSTYMSQTSSTYVNQYHTLYFGVGINKTTVGYYHATGTGNAGSWIRNTLTYINAGTSTWKINGSIVSSQSTTLSTRKVGVGFIHRAPSAAVTFYVDWIFVRQYSAVEPTFILNSEENQPTSLANCFTVTEDSPLPVSLQSPHDINSNKSCWYCNQYLESGNIVLGKSGNLEFKFTYTDPDAEAKITSYQFAIGTDSDVNNAPITTSQIPVTPQSPNSEITHSNLSVKRQPGDPSLNQIAYNTSYNWWIKVYNDKGKSSDWIKAPSAFVTPLRAFPLVRVVPKKSSLALYESTLMCSTTNTLIRSTGGDCFDTCWKGTGDTASLESGDWKCSICYNSSHNPVLCSIGNSNSFEWSLVSDSGSLNNISTPNTTIVSTNLETEIRTRLFITGSDGCAGEQGEGEGVGGLVPLPKWREVGL